MNEHWKGYPDYWSDFELRDVVETIWNNYHDKIKDLESFLSQIDDSKSVLTLSHKIRRTWLRLKWDMNTNVAHYTGTGRLLEIPNLVDDDYNEVDIPFQVDAENNTVILDADESMLEPYKTIDEDGRWSVKLWAPVYYIHNPVINMFYAPCSALTNWKKPMLVPMVFNRGRRRITDRQGIVVRLHQWSYH